MLFHLKYIHLKTNNTIWMPARSTQTVHTESTHTHHTDTHTHKHTNSALFTLSSVNPIRHQSHRSLLTLRSPTLQPFSLWGAADTKYLVQTLKRYGLPSFCHTTMKCSVRVAAFILQWSLTLCWKWKGLKVWQSLIKLSCWPTHHCWAVTGLCFQFPVWKHNRYSGYLLNNPPN